MTTVTNTTTSAFAATTATIAAAVVAVQFKLYLHLEQDPSFTRVQN